MFIFVYVIQSSNFIGQAISPASQIKQRLSNYIMKKKAYKTTENGDIAGSVSLERKIKSFKPQFFFCQQNPFSRINLKFCKQVNGYKASF